MNGPAARLVAPGDTVVIMGFELTDEQIKPTAVLVNKKNKFVKYIDTETPFTIIEQRIRLLILLQFSIFRSCTIETTEIDINDSPFISQPTRFTFDSIKL